MRFWKVRVGRWAMSSLSPRAKPKRSYTIVLVEAPDSETAMSNGVACAVNNAPFGPLWKEFEALEASSVELPFVIS